MAFPFEIPFVLLREEKIMEFGMKGMWDFWRGFIYRGREDEGSYEPTKHHLDLHASTISQI